MATPCHPTRPCHPLPILKQPLLTLKPSSCLLASPPSKWLSKPLRRRPNIRLNSRMWKPNLANSWKKKGEASGVLEAQASILTQMTLREATRLAIQVTKSMNEDPGDIKGKENEAMATSKLIFPSLRANLTWTYSLIGCKRLKDSSTTSIFRKAKR